MDCSVWQLKADQLLSYFCLSLNEDYILQQNRHEYVPLLLEYLALSLTRFAN